MNKLLVAVLMTAFAVSAQADEWASWVNQSGMVKLAGKNQIISIEQHGNKKLVLVTGNKASVEDYDDEILAAENNIYSLSIYRGDEQMALIIENPEVMFGQFGIDNMNEVNCHRRSNAAIIALDKKNGKLYGNCITLSRQR